MLKVAITGNIASGKSVVEKFLIQKGFNVLNTDDVTHELQTKSSVIEQIAQNFEGVMENGKISRKKLAKIVISDNSAKQILENILHPLIEEEIEKCFLDNADKKFVFVSIPLLFETGLEKLFDRVILVSASESVRLERL